MYPNRYIYLHGFASSPQSTKAQYLSDRFSSEFGVNLDIPDLNDNDFTSLTLTRQLEQVASAFPPVPMPVTLIGSSFGGLTAAWLAQKYPQVDRLLLLAPAFGFLSHWLPQLEESQLRQWQESGYLSVYHYGEKRSLPLHYKFLVDLRQYRENQLQRRVKTLILHGDRDDVIPVESSRNYARHRPWVELVSLKSDHALTDVMPQIWQAVKEFCDLP